MNSISSYITYPTISEVVDSMLKNQQELYMNNNIVSPMPPPYPANVSNPNIPPMNSNYLYQQHTQLSHPQPMYPQQAHPQQHNPQTYPQPNPQTSHYPFSYQDNDEIEYSERSDCSDDSISYSSGNENNMFSSIGNQTTQQNTNQNTNQTRKEQYYSSMTENVIKTHTGGNNYTYTYVYDKKQYEDNEILAKHIIYPQKKKMRK